MNDLIRVTGLWKNQSKDGTQYISGSWGSVKILVFKNAKKQKETDPDYNFCLAPIEKKDRAEEEHHEEEDSF